MSATWAAVPAILGTLALGAMSPGPSFVVVARTSAGRGRRAGFGAALGMGVGGLFYATLALLGLIALLTHVGWVYAAVRIAGGLYLVHLAYRLWRTAGEPPAEVREARRSSAFLGGLVTQLSNPKTAVVYAGVFAALLPADLSIEVALAVAAGVFVIEAGWYAVVALTFSATRSRSVYLGVQRHVDRTAGVVVGALGLRLASAGAGGLR